MIKTNENLKTHNIMYLIESIKEINFIYHFYEFTDNFRKKYIFIFVQNLNKEISSLEYVGYFGLHKRKLKKDKVVIPSLSEMKCLYTHKTDKILTDKDVISSFKRADNFNLDSQFDKKSDEGDNLSSSLDTSVCTKLDNLEIIQDLLDRPVFKTNQEVINYFNSLILLTQRKRKTFINKYINGVEQNGITLMGTLEHNENLEYSICLVDGSQQIFEKRLNVTLTANDFEDLAKTYIETGKIIYHS